MVTEEFYLKKGEVVFARLYVKDSLHLFLFFFFVSLSPLSKQHTQIIHIVAVERTKGAPRRTAASQEGTGHAGKTAMAVGRIS